MTPDPPRRSLHRTPPPPPTDDATDLFPPAPGEGTAAASASRSPGASAVSTPSSTTSSGAGRHSARRRSHPRRRRPADLALLIMGEVLFTAGAFIGLFLVWQLWWTNIEASENNSVAVAELDGVFEPEVVQRAERHTDAPPVIQPRGSNEPFAKLYVPRWGSSTLAIAEGLSYANVLDHGLVGHYPDTASIGEVGNAGLAAHRMTRGAVFQNIQDLQPGDELIVEGDSAWIVFSVTGHEVVNPNDGQVLLPVPHQPGVEADTPHLTLTTCHPLMSTRERYIVYSEFEYWIPRDEGMPDALLEK